MKIVQLLSIAFLLVSINACGANRESTPEAVRTAFVEKFPDVKKVKWHKESDTEWEAEFKQNGQEYSANFLADGTWKETEHEIKIAEIPAEIKKVLDTEFAGYKIEEAEISETEAGMVYEFEIEKGEESLEIAISTEGKVVKKENKEKNEQGENH